jgi:hypothetical protein
VGASNYPHRNQFRWIANAASVQADGANSDPISLSSNHLEALRDLASRMEPEESVVKPVQDIKDALTIVPGDY